MAIQRRRGWAKVACLSVLLLGVTVSGPVGAQPASDSAVAQALFDEAKALMKSGDHARACPKLEESQRLDPGSGTLINLADCYEQTGRLTSAWATFLDAAVASRAVNNVAREEVARTRAAALESRLPRLSIAVSGTPPPGLALRRGEQVVEPPQWGVPLPVDPGEHVVSATAPGRKPWSTRVVASAGAAPISVQVPELEPDDAAGSPAPSLSEPAPAPRAAEANGLGAQRTLALVSGGVGVVGVAVGTFYGLRSFSKHDEAAPYCDEDGGCSDPGYAAAEDALTAGRISTAAFIVGGVGLAAGAVLWFTTADAETAALPRSALGVGPGGLRWRASF